MTPKEVQNLLQINTEVQLSLINSYKKYNIKPTKGAYTKSVNVETVVLPAKPTKQELITFAEAILDNKNTDLAIVDVLKASGRYDYLDKIELQIPEYEYTEDLIEWNAKRSVRKIIEKKLNMYSWHTLDCKLFMLFMDGSISWDKLKETVKEDCKI